MSHGGTGTKDDPWQLLTAPGTSAFTMLRDEKDGTAILVCTVGKTVLHYDARCLEDLRAYLVAQGDLGRAGLGRQAEVGQDRQRSS